MGAFEDFVNVELPLRVSTGTSPAANKFPRATGVGKAVEWLTAAEMLATLAIQRGGGLYRQVPLSTDDYVVGFYPVAITISKVYAITNSGTVTFQLKYRTWTAPWSGGTNILSSPLVADSTGETTTSFANSTIPAESWIVFAASAITAFPGKLLLALKLGVV